MTRVEKVVAVNLDSYTVGGVSKRGLLTVELEDGRVLPVTSPSESGEPAGAGSYEYQAESGRQMAVRHGVRYGEVDHDLIEEVLVVRR